MEEITEAHGVSTKSPAPVADSGRRAESGRKVVRDWVCPRQGESRGWGEGRFQRGDGGAPQARQLAGVVTKTLACCAPTRCGSWLRSCLASRRVPPRCAIPWQSFPSPRRQASCPIAQQPHPELHLPPPVVPAPVGLPTLALLLPSAKGSPRVWMRPARDACGLGSVPV
jgi:hypothetical protein